MFNVVKREFSQADFCDSAVVVRQHSERQICLSRVPCDVAKNMNATGLLLWVEDQ